MRDRHPSVPILFISGYSQDAAAPGGVADVGENVLQKPFSPLGLLMKVWRMLEGAGGWQPREAH
jgi:CheY-like chemotaxis protein